MEQASILASWHTVETRIGVVQQLIQQQAVLRTQQSFKKYSYKSGKSQRRVFTLDGSGAALEWTGSGLFTAKHSVALTEIDDIREGNEAFECYKRRINLRLDPSEHCFSLRTPNGPLYLVADNKEIRDAWLTALRTVKQDQAAEPLMTDTMQAFVGELSALVEDRQRLELKLKAVTAEFGSLREEQEQLRGKLQEYEERLQGKEAEDVRRELEDYYNSLIVQRDQEITRQEAAIQGLATQLKAQDIKYTSSVLQLEERLAVSEATIRQAEADFSEYKESMKSRLADGIDAKAGQYRHANKLLTAYVAHLKRVSEDLEKEGALWKAAVYHFALVQYVEEHPGESPPMKEVLRFALEHVERHYNSVSTQRELVDILSQTRSIHSPQSFAWTEFNS